MTKRLTPLSNEESAFQSLPFVRSDTSTRLTSAWAPCDIPEDEQAHGYAERCAIGAVYAMDLIGHARQFGDGERVADVCEDIFKSGMWSGVEIGFFGALGDFIAKGTVRNSVHFDAKPIASASSNDPELAAEFTKAVELMRRMEAVGKEGIDDDDRLTKLIDEMYERAPVTIATPAKDRAELAVKLKLALWHDASVKEYDVAYLKAAIADLDRIRGAL